MSEKIKKYLKNSIGEKGNYCYSLPVETTKAVIKEIDRLNNIINGLEKYLIEMSDRSWDDNGAYDDVLDKLKKLKEDK